MVVEALLSQQREMLKTDQENQAKAQQVCSCPRVRETKDPALKILPVRLEIQPSGGFIANTFPIFFWLLSFSFCP